MDKELGIINLLLFVYIYYHVTISDPDSEQEFTLKLLVALFLICGSNFDEACKQIMMYVYTHNNKIITIVGIIFSGRNSNRKT